MNYGIMFQEYQSGPSSRVAKQGRSWVWIRTAWSVTAMFLTMAFSGNLYSSLVHQEYEPRTMLIKELFEKDLRLHISVDMVGYLKATAPVSKVNKLMYEQVNESGNIYDNG